MFKLNLHLQNLFYKENYKLLWFETFNLGLKNRYLEIQFHFYSRDLLLLDITTQCSGRDHAGPSIELSLLGLGMMISLPNTRHWNNTTNDWES